VAVQYALSARLSALLVGALCCAQARPAAAEQAAGTLQFLDADNRPIPDSGALGISRRVTHDRSLPRDAAALTVSPDPDNFRLQFTDSREPRSVVYATLQALSQLDRRAAGQAESSERHGLLRHVPLLRVAGTHQFRSPFLRLVSDATDVSAPDVGLQLLRAQLGDQVLATLVQGDAAAKQRVGSSSERARDSLRGTLRVFVLRQQRGGAPVLGKNDDEAVELARRQVEIANEIWAQCNVDFGRPESAEVRVVDPPGPTLLAFGDLDGLPARGDGEVSLRAGGKLIGPVRTQAGALPEQTALAVARAARAQGLLADVSLNPRADHGAHPSADLVLRDGAGDVLVISADAGRPMGTDAQQTVRVGWVDLADGISEFDNTISAVGTLEERTLVKVLGDGDPATIDVFLVNRFVNRDRQGEAFIEADGSSMANALIFDRNAVRYERQAWVQAHELGHVLLDEPLHPDNVGPDRPWLLMDADARQGRVGGPKRLTENECAQARRRSGPGAFPELLKKQP